MANIRDKQRNVNAGIIRIKATEEDGTDKNGNTEGIYCKKHRTQLDENSNCWHCCQEK